MAGSCGIDTEANALYESLVSGENVTIPNIDFNDTKYQIPTEAGNPLFVLPTKISNSEVTTKEVGGTGMFDQLMSSVKAHLKEEYEKGRITGAEYTKAYTELVTAAMSSSIQFVLGREQSYWASIQSQMQARLAQVQVVNARVALEVTKTEYVKVKFQAMGAKSEFALGKIRLATEGVNYCISQYTLSDMLPAQKQLVEKQVETADYNLTYTLPKQLQQLDAQVLLVKEQYEVQRAQTMETRSDTLPVLGTLGKQKDLYSQQITSYKRDSEVKAAKLFTDAWITMKTIDEGVLPPNGFVNTSLDQVLSKLKTENGFT